MNSNMDGPLSDPRTRRNRGRGRNMPLPYRDRGEQDVEVLQVIQHSVVPSPSERERTVNSSSTYSSRSNISCSDSQSNTQNQNYGDPGFATNGSHHVPNYQSSPLENDFQRRRSGRGPVPRLNNNRESEDYGQRNTSLDEETRQFRRQLEKFISEKRGLIYRPLAPDEKPSLESRKDEQQNEGCYGLTPTLDMCMGLDPTERRIEFYKSATVGDILLTKMCSETNGGIAVRLLCFEGKKHAFLEDLDIKATCLKWDMIPVDLFDLSKYYEVGDNIRCEIIKLTVVPNTTVKDIQLGMRSIYTSDLKEAFPLGLVSKQDLPDYYELDRTLWKSKKRVDYDYLLRTSSGFNNLNSCAFVGSLLGIYSNHNSLTEGLSHPFPTSSHASSLRQVQNAKLAQDNLNQGLEFLKIGDSAKALDSFSKTIIVDPENIRALVSRLKIYLKMEHVAEAARDIDAILKRDLQDVDLKKDVAQCLVTIGKIYQKRSEEENAFKSYSDCLLVVPEHPDTLKLLMDLHSQIEHLTIQGLITTKLLDLKNSLSGMVEEEIAKERSGYYRKMSTVMSHPNIADYSRPFRHYQEIPTPEIPTAIGRSLEGKNALPSNQFSGAPFVDTRCRTDSTSDATSVRKKKKSKRKKSRRRSRSYSPSVPTSFPTSNLAECETIKDQVDAFLAKCERDSENIIKPIALESVRITIAQDVPQKPEVRFVPADAESYAFLQGPNIGGSAMKPLPPIKYPSLPNKITLSTDKYGNIYSSEESKIVQSQTVTTVSKSKFEMTISAPKPASTFVPIPTVFSSPSTSSDESAVKPMRHDLNSANKWKPVLGQAVDGTLEPENTLKNNSEELGRMLPTNLKLQSVEKITNCVLTRSNRSSSPSTSSLHSHSHSKSRPKSQSRRMSCSSVSTTRSRSTSSSRSQPHVYVKTTESSSYFSSTSRSSTEKIIGSIGIHKPGTESKDKEESGWGERQSTNSLSVSRGRNIFASKDWSRSRSRERSRSSSESRDRSGSSSESRERSGASPKSRERSRSTSRSSRRSTSATKSRSLTRQRSRSRLGAQNCNNHFRGKAWRGNHKSRSHRRSTYSTSSTSPTIPPHFNPHPVRIPRRGRGGYNPNYISPNYRGYNPIPAYKLERFRTKPPQTGNSYFEDQSSDSCRTPGKVVPPGSTPESPCSN